MNRKDIIERADKYMLVYERVPGEPDSAGAWEVDGVFNSVEDLQRATETSPVKGKPWRAYAVFDLELHEK